MKAKTELFLPIHVRHGVMAISKALPLFVAGILMTAPALRAADEAGAQRLLTQARAKEAHAQELRAAAAAALQKASDDQLEASGEDRDARILTAQALKLMGADANKQKAFRLRQEAHKLWNEDHNMLVAARNDEQKGAQLAHNAAELRKSAAELKDQATVAATLEGEAKQAETDAAAATQAAGQAKQGASVLDERGRAAWAEAEKLDPETHRQVAQPVKPVIAQQRQVK